MRPKLTPMLLLGVFLVLNSLQAQSRKDLDKLVKRTDTTNLPYDPQEIVVRGFDGANPPPLLETPDRPLLYGYGMTSYIIGFDSITFFDIVMLDAVHRDREGLEIKRFVLRGEHYTREFKNYFLEKCTKEDRAHIFFENIYLRDKKGNYLKIDAEQQFCPHCIP